MIRYLALVMALLILVSVPALAQRETADDSAYSYVKIPRAPLRWTIDTPTAGMLPRGSFDLSYSFKKFGFALKLVRGKDSYLLDPYRFFINGPQRLLEHNVLELFGFNDCHLQLDRLPPSDFEAEAIGARVEFNRSVWN